MGAHYTQQNMILVMNWRRKIGNRKTEKVTKIIEEGNNGVIKDKAKIGDKKVKLEHQK